MSRFWTGFGVASALWVAAGAALVFVGGFGPPQEAPPEPIAEAPEPLVEEAEPEPDRRRRRRRRRRAAAGRGAETPTGEATTGDDLREGEMRTLDMEGSGGEQQLRPAQIEAGFDTVMGRIRRCLILIEGDGDVRGTVNFGMRIQPSGSVEGVRLSGPRAATTGAAGDCLRTTARSIRFDSYDGPPQVVRYPLHLE